jgi:hypothetical protein
VAEQILIEFVGDTSQLLPAIDVLEQLGQIDSKAAEAFRKSNSEISKRSDILKKVNAEETKQIKSLKDIEKAVDSVASSFVDGFKGEVADALSEAGVSVDDLKVGVDGLEKSTNKLGSAEESLKKQLREMTAQLAQMEIAGKRNTAEYNELVAKAGEVKDAINDAGEAIANAGSDTRGMDNLIGLASGVAGGFAIAQGAAALFGNENEEVQKVLLKVNAAMAILQGLQQIQALMSMRQFQSTAALIGVQRIQTAQTFLQAGAESDYVAVRWLAVVAQRALNSVMLANPLLLIITLVVAAAAAWKAFTSSEEEAIETQKDLNRQIEEGQKINQAFIDAEKSYGQERVAQLKLNRASSEKIRAAELESLKKQLQQNKDFENSNAAAFDAVQERRRDIANKKVKANEEEITELNKFYDQYTSIQKNGFDLENEIQLKQIENETEAHKDRLKNLTAFADAQVLIQREGSRQQLVEQINAIRTREKEELESESRLPGEIAKIRAAANKEVDKLRSQLRVFDLTEEKNLLEAKLATVQEGSLEELEIRKQVAQVAADVEINQYGLTETKKKALRAQSAHDQEEFDRQISVKRSEIELNGIKAQLALAKEGSAEEYKLKLDQLQGERNIELLQKGVTDDKKLLIENEYLRKVRDLNKQYNLQIQQEAIQIKQSETNAKLAEMQKASVSDTNAELLQLKKDAIDEQAALDVLQARNSINNQELLAARLKEIWSKSAADKLAIDQAAAKAKMEFDMSVEQQALSNEAKSIKLSLLQGEGNVFQRAQMRKRITAIEKEQIDLEYNENVRAWRKGLITYEDFKKKQAEIQGKYTDLEIKTEEDKEERKKQLINAGFEVLNQISAAYFEGQFTDIQNSLNLAIKQLEDQKAKELDNKNLTEQQKADIDKRYRDKELQEKKKAWLAEQQAKKQQALINGALAITNILATMPKFDFGIASAIAIAAAIATTAVQVAKINNAKFPGFKTGTKKAPKGFAWVGEEGPELMELAGGEKIWKYSESMKVAEAWRGGRQAHPDEILAMNIPSSVDSEILSTTYVNAGGSMDINYDKLGRSMAKHVKPATVVNNMDKNGFTTYVIEEGSKKEIRNQRYRMN